MILSPPPKNSALQKQSFCKYIDSLNMHLKGQCPEFILSHNRDLPHIFSLRAKANIHSKEAPSPQWLGFVEHSRHVREPSSSPSMLLSGKLWAFLGFHWIQQLMTQSWSEAILISVLLLVLPVHVTFSALAPLPFGSHWNFKKPFLPSVSFICSTVSIFL